MLFVLWFVNSFLVFCKVDGKILNFFEIYGILKFEGILVSSFLVVDKKGFFRFLNEELRIIKRVLFFLRLMEI